MSRIINETRLIFWPWCLTTLAGLAPLIKLGWTDKRTAWPDAIAVFGFFGGAAILTAVSFGAALGTYSSERRTHSGRIWAEKMVVVAVAAVSAGMIACLAQMAAGVIVWTDLRAHNAFEPVLLLVIIVCSTGFWTLLARSVVGGLLLGVVAQLILYLLLVLFATLINRMAPADPDGTTLVHAPEVHAAASWFIGGVGLSYAAIMLWLGRKRFAGLFVHSDAVAGVSDPIKSIIRSFSAPTEFCLVVFIGFGLTIVGVSVSIINQFTGAAATPAVIRFNNTGIVEVVVIQLVTLGLVLWMGKIRGWSLATFGFRLSWKEITAGVLLFCAFLLLQQGLGFLTREVFRSTVDFHRVITGLTIPFVILISVVNPVFEESLQAGYFFRALQRHGMWTAVLSSAAFRAFLHSSMGISGFVFMFAQGLLFGFVYWRWRQLWPLIIAHALQMLYSLLPPFAT